MSSGATSAWKLVTPTVSKARAPTQAMSTFPAFTSSSVPASYSGSPRRQSFSNSISSVPPESRLTSSAQLASWRAARRRRVRQSEHARLGLVGSAGLVAARAAARGQGNCRRRERRCNRPPDESSRPHRRAPPVVGCLRRYGRSAPCTSGRSLDPNRQSMGRTLVPRKGQHGRSAEQRARGVPAGEWSKPTGPRVEQIRGPARGVSWILSPIFTQGCDAQSTVSAFASPPQQSMSVNVRVVPSNDQRAVIV